MTEWRSGWQRGHRRYSDQRLTQTPQCAALVTTARHWSILLTTSTLRFFEPKFSAFVGSTGPRCGNWFAEWNANGLLRQPRFETADRQAAADCRREHPRSTSEDVARAEEITLAKR